MSSLNWVFDLDNTLHDADHGIFPSINRLMTTYIIDNLKVGQSEAEALREKYWQEYGATLRGLILHHGINANAFLQFTHPMDQFTKLVKWEPSLRNVLENLPGKKFVMSNGPDHYVKAIIEHIGIEDLFSDYIGVESLGFSPKPEQAAFDRLFERIHEKPESCVMVEDSLANLERAKSLGMKTVWIDPDCRAKPDYVDVQLQIITELNADCLR